MTIHFDRLFIIVFLILLIELKKEVFNEIGKRIGPDCLFIAGR